MLNNRPVNFIRRNKTHILLSALAVTAVYAYALTRNKEMFDEFLKEHNLFEEYYTPEDSY